MHCFYIFQITALVQQHPGDLEAVEKEAAEEGHSQVAASSSVRKPKSKSEEEADFQEALLKSLEESRRTIAGMMIASTCWRWWLFDPMGENYRCVHEADVQEEAEGVSNGSD